MNRRAFVGTRKGLFTFSRESSGWRLSQCDFRANQVTIFHRDPLSGTLYAGIKHEHFGAKLHRSQDNGKTWQEVGTPAFPPKPDDYVDKPMMDGKLLPWELKTIWALQSGGADRPGHLWLGCLPGGLFQSTDFGDTWELNARLWLMPERQMWFGGGADWPGIHSICVDPANSDEVAVGVSCGGMWTTLDGGTTWQNRSKGMRAAYMPPEMAFDVNIQDPHCVVQSPSNPNVFWCQHHNGVFRTENRGLEWSEITNVPPSVFGFPIRVHPHDADTAWTIPAEKDEIRLPVAGSVSVARTRDGGKSWQSLTHGLPQQDAYDIVFRHAMDVDAEGNTLMFGSTTGNLWVSENQGDQWTCLSHHLPPVYCVAFT